MIASLRGQVLRITTSSAVIEAGGVGYVFLAAPDTLASLRVGEEGFVYVTMVVSREGEPTLFGFGDDDARAIFEVLKTVTGIGPRSALQILSALPPNDLRHAIASKNEAALVKVPGIGKKTAQRMVLELDGKLGEPSGAPVATESASDSEVVAALVNMGWKEHDAATALGAARQQIPDGGVADLLRAALQILGQRR
ncbi:Holliday junction branch migration protein RuvA [Trueperella bialowiezensis]|uniref:Holliday junction branch migration complex subunit RuvA n=1 Tax=Trueperella bialowiezensis TaxID=312285 RepID=A0A448PBZ0_9ACTO|nr:Holliday junction branch migration protein RuvA [Trueperella bialowiezensis]VEI12481.1 Holliday junction ATP-dependent DNA helicase RuvA [Trueperella bialowiezensis]